MKGPNGLGDRMLGNFLLEPGEQPPAECLPAMGEDVTCNPVSDVVAEKSVDPEDGSEVASGDELTYTLTFRNRGQGAGAVDYVDDLRGVLDDATMVREPRSSDPGLDLSVRKGRLRITGELAGGTTARVTYTVRVKAYDDQGDHVLENVLAAPGSGLSGCTAGDPMCTRNPVDPPEDPVTPDEPDDNPLLPRHGWSHRARAGRGPGPPGRRRRARGPLAPEA
ncbi:hypothetical protein [Nocardioides sp. TF02-7]|uniref:DUF7927 domain-containing protein n=1 Tax=Nocardioides sp. TF02-7 TaxID=2917724 RepID=UPI001F062075|nr:hypothetical protein [Nocardioides sp. TF02-7]UMG93866.1 hypothetical protein MF408_06995 [Nocardioides sp. TF02-7]